MYNNNNVNNIAKNPEDIYPPHFDVEKKYRGALVDRSLHQLALGGNNGFGNNGFGNNDNRGVNCISSHKESESSTLVSLADKFTVQKHNIPDAPLFLCPTHFIVNSCIHSLILRIHHVLGNVPGVSCEFLEYQVIFIICFFLISFILIQ